MPKSDMSPQNDLNPQSDMIFNFFRAPYDVRRAIYQVFYPANTTVQLTSGPPAWANGVNAPYRMSTHGRKLLQTCSSVRDEAYQMLYISNTFLLAPGAINYHPGYGRSSTYFLHNSKLFIRSLRLSTRMMIKSLHLFVGPDCHVGGIEMFSGIGDFPRVVVEVDSLASVGLVTRSGLRESQRDICKAIIRARYRRQGKETLWKAGSEVVAQMLRELMPIGYQKAR